jgi:hypothetical protein
MNVLASGPSISRRAALPALAVLCAAPASGQAAECSIPPANCKGWGARQPKNGWGTLAFGPQAGGRLIPVRVALRRIDSQGRERRFWRPFCAGSEP